WARRPSRHPRGGSLASAPAAVTGEGSGEEAPRRTIAASLARGAGSGLEIALVTAAICTELDREQAERAERGHEGDERENALMRARLCPLLLPWLPRSPQGYALTLQQLQYFLAAFRHGSFSAAAEELHLAQPSLSEQVRRLEAELGVRLFQRVGRGLKPTEAGHTLPPPRARAARR